MFWTCSLLRGSSTEISFRFGCIADGKLQSIGGAQKLMAARIFQRKGVVSCRVNSASIYPQLLPLQLRAPIHGSTKSD